MDVFTAGQEKLESLNKDDQVSAQKKKDLFSLLPPQTKKNILLQASGKWVLYSKIVDAHLVVTDFLATKCQ